MTVHPTDQISEAVVAPDCSITSGATTRSSVRVLKIDIQVPTPVRAPDYFSVLYCSSGISRDTKVGQLNTTVLVRENIGTLDVAMYDTLIVEVDETFENLGDVHSNKSLRELSEPLANVV